MNDFFQEHKRFLVTWVAGGLVFLILWLIVGQIHGDDIALYEYRAARHRRASRAALPEGVDLAALREEDAEQQRALERLVGALARRPAPIFNLQGVSDPDVRYEEATQSIRDTRVEECEAHNIRILDPSLGRPSQYPDTAGEFAWYLRGLDVVDQLLGLVLEAEDVQAQGISRVERIEIRPPPKEDRGAATPFATHHRVGMTLVGHPTSVAFIVEALARRPGGGRGPGTGRALILHECRLRSLDQPPGLIRRDGRRDPLERGRVEAVFEVASVDIDREGRVLGELAR